MNPLTDRDPPNNWRAVTRLVEVADDLRDWSDHWTRDPAARRYLRSTAAEVDEVTGWLATTAPDPPGAARRAVEASPRPSVNDHTRERDDCRCDRPGRSPRHDR